jgi:beta-lactamase class A
VTVPHVLGLPCAARPRWSAPFADAPLARSVTSLGRGFRGIAGIYVRSLSSGAGAAWNARARFPAASTLKVAIAVEVLRELGAKPAPGSPVDSLLRRMLIESDNDAANRLEVLLGGSTIGGGARVDELLRALGLADTEMYGGYLRSTQARRPAIPLRVEEQPSFGRGKYTTAFDLARLLADVHYASTGNGPLSSRVRGFTPSDARYLLYLLAQVGDRGKLGRYLGGRGLLLHKAGWISGARHDAGLVYTGSGVFVAAVMTFGADDGDELAGRVARGALTLLPARSPRAP